VRRLAAAEAAAELGRQREAFAEQAREQLANQFKVLAADTLAANSQQFLQQIRATLETLGAQTAGQLGQHREAVASLLQPLKESLSRYEQHLAAVEKTRAGDYGRLDDGLRRLAENERRLIQETNQLATSLRNPQVRGRWGEMALRRVVSLAGMTAHCDFDEQATIEAGRPDMIVHLPDGRDVVIDAKTPLDAYLDAVGQTDPEARAAGFARHAQRVRTQVQELRKKRYWAGLPNAAQFVVLFLPGESFFSAALEHDAALLEDAAASNVLLASPSTLIALLRAVATGWQQRQMAENAQRIAEAGRDLHQRLNKLIDHLGDTGQRLARAVEAFNRTVGSLDRMVLPAARRLESLGAYEPTGDVAPVEAVPRPVDAGSDTSDAAPDQAEE